MRTDSARVCLAGAALTSTLPPLASALSCFFFLPNILPFVGQKFKLALTNGSVLNEWVDTQENQSVNLVSTTACCGCDCLVAACAVEAEAERGGEDLRQESESPRTDLNSQKKRYTIEKFKLEAMY